MASIINASTAGVGGVITTADNSGVLNIQTAGTTAITVSATQNVGIGVTPSASSVRMLQGPASLVVSSQGDAINIASNAYFNSGWKYSAAASTAATNYVQTASQHIWYNAPNGTAGNAITFTQAMTLDASGNLLVGTTSPFNANDNGFNLVPGTGTAMVTKHINGTASGSYYSLFTYNGAYIGSITQNGTTGVLYNLTSDYRLKDNPEVLTDAKDFIMALQPKTWDWWDGSGKGVGFIAHEFMEVAKYSGNGDKDATKEEQYEISPATPAVLDEEGVEVAPAVEAVMGTRTVPVYQSIQPSSSEVMANIVAFIQEQQAMIQELKAEIDLLKGAK